MADQNTPRSMLMFYIPLTKIKESKVIPVSNFGIFIC